MVVSFSAIQLMLANLVEGKYVAEEIINKYSQLEKIFYLLDNA